MEKTIKKILVGFDGRDQSRDALLLADNLAREEGAELIVAAVFSVDPLPFPSLELFEDQEQWFGELFAKARGQLGHDFETRKLAWNSPARALNDLAEEEAVDLIVVGSAHRGTVGRVLAGSVGEALLHGAPCAVAVAPRGFADRDHAGIGLVGVGYDGTEEAKLALEEGLHWARAHDCGLRLITVISTVAPSPLRAPYMQTLRDHFRELQEEAMAGLGKEIEAEAVLEEGDPAAVLATHGVELDLLVIGSRGYGPLRRTLLGGVSEEVIRTAPCPVLVVPRSAQSHVAQTLSGASRESGMRT